MANNKDMTPISGDRVETDGVYRDPYGHEVKLETGDNFPMDPQLGAVEFEMVAFTLGDKTGDADSDREAAMQANVPISAVSEEEEESRQKRQLKHRLHGGNR